MKSEYFARDIAKHSAKKPAQESCHQNIFFCLIVSADSTELELSQVCGHIGNFLSIYPDEADLINKVFPFCLVQHQHVPHLGQMIAGEHEL